MFDERTQKVVAKAAHDDTLATKNERKRLVNFVRTGLVAKDVAIPADDAAKILGITRRALYYHIYNGRIRKVLSCKYKRMFVSLASVEEVLDGLSAYEAQKHIFEGNMRNRKKADAE